MSFLQENEIWNAVRTELSWTHYRIICRLETENLRKKDRIEILRCFDTKKIAHGSSH